MYSSKTESFIASAETFLVRVPLERAHGDAIQKFTALELPMVIVKDGSGRSGTGFSYTIGSGGSAVVELIRRELLPLIIGKDSSPIGAIHELLYNSIHALTPGCIASLAISPIDVALWDLAAKRCDVPLHLMLGGARERVKLYNTDVGWLSRSLEELVEYSAKAVRDDGFKALKLKVGKPDIDEDRERIAAVRQAVGSGVELMVDANQSWTLPEAVRRAKMLEEFDIKFLEEPLPAQQIDNFVKLGQQTSLARAGGESIYSCQEFFQCLREGALDILQPDVARIGGITNAMKVCALAQCAGLSVSPHVSPELSIVVASAIKNSIFVEYIPAMEPILKSRLKIVDGYGIPSQEAGHGIKFDWDKLKSMEVAYARSEVG